MNNQLKSKQRVADYQSFLQIGIKLISKHEKRLTKRKLFALKSAQNERYLTKRKPFNNIFKRSATPKRQVGCSNHLGNAIKGADALTGYRRPLSLSRKIQNTENATGRARFPSGCATLKLPFSRSSRMRVF